MAAQQPARMILSQHTQRIIFHKAMASAHLIAAEHDCAVSDVLDLLVTAPFTPSQPTPPLAADTPVCFPAGVKTGGGGDPSSLPSSPVDLSGLAAHEQGPIPSPAAPPAGDAADGKAETLLSKPSVATKQKRVYGRQELVIRTHHEHPDWPDSVIAKHLGVHDAYVRTTATRLGLTLPSRRNYDEAQKAKTTEALKAPPAKPQEAVEPPPAPKARPRPEQPPAPIPVARAMPLPPPVVTPMQKAPQGRFYLKEKTPIGKPSRWVHQSLTPSPTGPGPLMTLDRKWAWYDTMDRFKGAVKKWPELKAMRKEAVTK